MKPIEEPDVQNENEYQSYLLRLWRAGATGPKVWRASLENPRTGERLGFANLEQLFVFLMEHTEQTNEGGDDC